MPESLGARLRQRREDRQIPLGSIAEQTKIKLSLLEALERDDLSHWPTGIFRRAYVRAYAHTIGLDPTAVLREFLQVHPDPDEEVETLPGGQAGRSYAAPPTRLRTIVDSAIGSLSRLRHGAGVEDTAVARDAPATPPAPPEPDLPADVVRAPADPDLLAVARLCTALGRAAHADDVQPLLQEAAGLLDATGLVVWLWDARVAGLRSALAHGYSASVLAQLPAVELDADNVTAAAFRSGQTCVINGGAHATGALAVPLLTPAGCAGVLALELQHGGEQTSSVRAVATILAALLAQLTCAAQPAESEDLGPAARRASGDN